MSSTRIPHSAAESKTDVMTFSDDSSVTQPPIKESIIHADSLSVQKESPAGTIQWTSPPAESVSNTSSETQSKLALPREAASHEPTVIHTPDKIAVTPVKSDAIPKVTIVSDNLVGDNLNSNVQLGDYTLIECVGGGGMGRVYRALDNRLDRFVALKVLAPNQNSDDFRERFTIEAKASAKLHHENIVTVYSYGEIDGLTFLAMEYIPGVNIRDLVTQKGSLSVEDTLSYAIQLAAALEHINQKGIVHRDIKPSNVLITDDNTVKVIDLGLAKNNMAPADELTATGVTLGTFDYISPEQARDPRQVDIRSDIYSMGCSLFYMLTGQPPYPKGTALQKLLRHQGEAPPNVQDFRPDVPDRLANIINRCMAKDAEMRYQTPQDLSKALYIAAEELGMRPMGISLAKWYLPTFSRLKIWKDRLWWALPLVGLILLVMALDGIWKMEPREVEFLPDVPGLKRDITQMGGQFENSESPVSNINNVPENNAQQELNRPE